MPVRPSSVALWTGILAGPLAWAADLQAKYALQQYVCANQNAMWINWIITLAALVLTAFGAFNAWRGWTLGGGHQRVRTMAMTGLMISGMFALSIVAMSIPDFFFKACD